MAKGRTCTLLREADYDDALAELTRLRGIADKVANCVMLFSLDKPQAFPVDVWIVKAMRDWYPECAACRRRNQQQRQQDTRPPRNISARCGSGRWSDTECTAGYANQYYVPP